MKTNTTRLFIPLLAGALLAFSCTDDDDFEIPQEGIESAHLVFTELSGDDHLGAHGDHFHGIDGAEEGESFTIEFDTDGNALSGGHLHLDVHGIYKIELRAWDYEGNRVEGDYIADKATSDWYKAFLVGGDFVLNTETEDESGAIFQPREKEYVDGSPVEGGYETTGILSYFTLGESNEGETVAVSFVLRKFDDASTKSSIERVDWNSEDYASRFPGEDELVLNFEIHPEHGEDDHEEGHDHEGDHDH